jgi:FlaA1/EpsC-like NDP-sugar epimerase
VRTSFKLQRARVAYLHDVIMAGASFMAAQYLRLGDAVVWYSSQYLWLGLAIFMAVAAGVFASMNLYRGVWRYASVNDMMGIVKAATLTILIFLLLLFFVTRLEALPRSSLVINWLVLIAFLGGPRALYRVFKDRRLDTLLARDGRSRIPVLLVGAGDGAELFIRAVNRRPNANYLAVGILTSKATRLGRQIHGVPVLGTPDQLGEVVERLKRMGQRPRRVIITREYMDGAAVRRLLDDTVANGMTLARLPELTDFEAALDENHISVRPIAIEDLLGRPQAVLDRDAMRAMIAGKRVLITGAGGTIGSELVRQVSDFEPARLVLVDLSEAQLYEIDRELGARKPALARSAILADVRDRRRIAAVIRDEAPELVFHAAALKHVPMVETHPSEGVLTNVVGTRNVADACREVGVGLMVFISTDKAVNPSSVMGATKRLSEQYCQSLDLAADRGEGTTRFVAVRFGNVLGSTGSVVPLFTKQLEAGGPLTVTHPDVTRYFMTVREAVELVLEASALGSSEAGYSGRVFVLDMGEPIRIQDLARQMIRLAGLEPDKDVEIAFTGLRPGEKLHEALIHQAEAAERTRYRDIMVVAPRAADHALIARAIDELAEQARGGSGNKIVATLRRLVPEYQPPAEAPADESAAPGRARQT